MADRPIRFAVAGLGMGLHHCRDLRDARGCELRAICDTDPERLRTAAAEFPVRAVPSYDELLADPDIDVINICTPSGTHADLAVAALHAGKHVVCEKPPDVTVAAVDRMIAAQRETGRYLMVIFQSRFEPIYQLLREAIAGGRLGRVIGVHGTVNWWRAQSYFTCPGMWKGTWRMDGGGSLANQGVHTLDLLQWLAGPVREVYARYGVFSHDIETEDKTAEVLTFASGALGTLTTTTSAYPGLDRTVFIHGDRGSVVVEDDLLRRWRIAGQDPAAEKEEERVMLERYGPREQRVVTTASDPFAFATRGHLLQFEAMADAIHGRAPLPNSIETTRHTIELLEAIYVSGREGRPVSLA
jgi:UDP-N-acetyl-2-amino-2-deoxyglucuronate dehydrogenase